MAKVKQTPQLKTKTVRADEENKKLEDAFNLVEKNKRDREAVALKAWPDYVKAFEEKFGVTVAMQQPEPAKIIISAL
jgi:hypothetical protein